MYNWFTISMIMCWAVVVYFFYIVIYSKIKLHNARVKIQEQGVIEANVNITVLTFKSLVYWMSPVRKYLNQDNKEHSRLAKKVNVSLLGMFVMVVVFGFLITVLR